MAERAQSRQEHNLGTHVLTASAHIITAVMGTEVLSLSYDVSQLGWIVGMIVLLLFAFMTYCTTQLLTACYMRNRNYMDTVRDVLGDREATRCGASQYFNLAGLAISYTIAASASTKAIYESVCFHIAKGTSNSSCGISSIGYNLGFGVVQLFLSQIPSFYHLWWLSMISGLMCLIYPSIVTGLSFAKVAEAKKFKGNLRGIRINGSLTGWPKIFNSFQAVGDIMFAYPFSLIFFEIQDTIDLESRQSQYKAMKKATRLSLSVITILCVLCGCFGYAAFGHWTPQNLLTDFGLYNPYWLRDIANVAVVIHHIGAYQVCSQPIFAFIEKTAEKLCPNSTFINDDISIFGSTKCKLNLFRVVSRCIFVIITTLISLLMPVLFKDVLGVLGAAGNWRLAVGYPVAMYIVQLQIGKWSKKGICLQLLSMFCLAIYVAAAVGSFVGLLSHVKANF